MVDALERMAAHSVAGAAVHPVVRWTLAHHAGDMYRLTIQGDLAARDVSVTSHKSLWLSDTQGGPDLRAHEALTFMAAPDFGTSDMTITVTWYDDTDPERQIWRYPLPPRPPR